MEDSNLQSRPTHMDAIVKHMKRMTYVLLFVYVVWRLLMIGNEDSCRSLFSALTKKPTSCMTKTYTASDIERCVADKPTRLALINNYGIFGELEHDIVWKNWNTNTSDLVKQIRTNESFQINQGSFAMRFFKLEKLTAPKSTLSNNITKLWGNFSPTHVFISLTPEIKVQFANMTSYHPEFEQLFALFNETLQIPVFWILQDPPIGSVNHPQRLNTAILKYNQEVMKQFSHLPNVYIIRITQPVGRETSDSDYPCADVPAGPKNLVVTLAARTLLYRLGNQSNVDVNRDPNNECLSTIISKQIAQRFWNFHCNNHMRFERSSCCRKPDPMNETQRRCFILIGVCVFITIILFLYAQCIKRLHRKDTVSPFPSTPEHLVFGISFEEFYNMFAVLSQFGIILVYIYLCDRTLVFYNDNTEFGWTRLAVGLIFLTSVGLLFTRKTEKMNINNVNITREWKGFMQLYILLYHYLSAYDVLSTYLWARISVSSYLFLSGFGHFSYFWHQSPPQISFSDTRSFLQSLWPPIKRYLDVMYRINVLTVALCFIMNRNYLLYYFVPLVSLWFTTVFLLMCSWPRVSGQTCEQLSESGNATSTQQCLNADQAQSNRSASSINHRRIVFLIMFLKILILAAVNHTIYVSKSTFHWIFHTGFAKNLFKLDLTIPNVLKQSVSADRHAEEVWYYRWSLDRYSTVYGLLFAMVLEWLYSSGLLHDNNRSINQYTKSATLQNQTTSVASSTGTTVLCFRHFWGNGRKAIQITSTLLGLIGLGVTLIYTITSTDWASNIKMHAVWCIVPILSYVLVRNSFDWLRCRFSVFFAWIGDIALELYVAQHHIWLSADGYGIFVLWPGFPLLNVILTTWTFALISAEIHQLTGRLQKYLVPKTPSGLLWTCAWMLALILFLHASV